MKSSSSWTFLTTTSLDQRNPSRVSKKTPKQMKKTASRNKPIKVRYISNPMRVKTCASKFRELVQELTGQDAVDLELEPEFSPSAVSDDSSSPRPPENLAPRDLHQEPFDDRVTGYYEPLNGEEMFVSQLSGGFSGYFSNEFYNGDVDGFGKIDLCEDILSI
ncbi:hypothetical protein BRARA_D00332 [Brassica rapa]|uniref:VQ domain-containing protein n=1 Tax=Brassica campestris TaxID=3711 RepID=A0A397ZHH8_BRACM|nr:hypothetical protein BRARA_D00332 [Brassica rapa]CAG7905497.1 unnamed protein product [Brassica rapa]VDD10684.1 unnamed protein product [Brassica rapa]